MTITRAEFEERVETAWADVQALPVPFTRDKLEADIRARLKQHHIDIEGESATDSSSVTLRRSHTEVSQNG